MSFGHVYLTKEVIFGAWKNFTRYPKSDFDTNVTIFVGGERGLLNYNFK